MKSDLERPSGWVIVCSLLVLTPIASIAAGPARGNPFPRQQTASTVTQESNAQPPVSELELGTMLVRGDPEEKIIVQVRQRGLASTPNENLVWSLTTLGASPALVDAVRLARINPNYTPDPARVRGVASEAESVFRAALESRAGNPVLHRLYGVALDEKGRRDEAMREYREGLRLAPNDAAAHTLMGMDLLKQGNREAALSEFRDAVRFAPKDAVARFRLGVLLNEQRDYGRAEAQLREAVRLDPGYAAAHNSLAVALEGEGKFDAALSEYREALRLKPDSPEARSNIAAIQNKMAGQAGQIAQLNEAVQRDPNDPVAHNNLGLALRDQGDLDGAIREFREAARLKPGWAEAHANLGKALGAKGDFDGAIAEFRSAVQLQGGVAENHFLLGAYLERKGDKTAALAAYRMAFVLEPGNATYKERSEFLERELAMATPAAPAPGPATTAQPQTPQDVLRTFKSISLICRTVWMPWDDMQGALEHRAEFHDWGLSIRREGQPADVRLEIDRPFFTFDWTYKLIDPATEKELASAQVTAWDGPTAAPQLAELIIDKISAARHSAARAPTTAAVPPTGTRVNRWPVRYMAGSENLKPDSEARLVVAGGRIYVSGEQGTSFLIRPQDVIAVSCSSKIKDPSEGWYLFWSSAFESAEDVQTAAGILALLPVIWLGGALIEQAKTTEYFVRIDWMENHVLHNAVIRVNDEEYKPFMAELEAVTEKPTSDIDAMIAKLREELKTETTNRWVIYPDRVVQVAWKKLEPGSYVAILLKTTPMEGTIYFLPLDGNVEHVLAQAAVEVQERKADIEPEFTDRNAPPKLSFKEENGITSFSEIRTPDLVMRFTMVPLAPTQTPPYSSPPPTPPAPETLSPSTTRQQPATSEKASMMPLLGAELAMMLARGDPSQQIVAQIRARGLAIRPDSQYLWSLTAVGATPEVLDAVRTARVEANFRPDAAWRQKIGAEAEPVLRAALKERPDNAALHAMLGAVLAWQKRYNEAIAEYRLAIQMKDDYALAHYNISIALRRTHDIAGASLELRKAAELGYAPAQSDMGLACYHGQGVPQDPGAAVTWFRKAAQQADPLGQYGLGICYMEGVGVRQEYKEAEVWIRKAAEQGYVRAQYALARLYNFGLGVTRDYAESASWYRKAAEQGYAVAQVDLGVAYMEGEGVPKSEEEGIKWFERASEQGDALGTYYAALFYWKKGHPQAMEKFELAATQGAPFGAFTLGEIYSRSLKSEGQTDKLKACVWFRIAEELDKQGDWERQRPDDTRKLRAELPKRLSQLRAELNSTQFADCQRQASEWVKTHVQQPPQ